MALVGVGTKKGVASEIPVECDAQKIWFPDTAVKAYVMGSTAAVEKRGLHNSMNEWSQFGDGDEIYRENSGSGLEILTIPLNKTMLGWSGCIIQRLQRCRGPSC